ncbi:MAG TPA: hypothetical protein VE078_10495 [Thermoanaerobaculia bacterium]|nr:hypothetical protein [Thermoanaerobaculia bacterium]
MSRQRKTTLAASLSWLVVILSGCGSEAPPRLGAAGPRPAEIPASASYELGTDRALLVATGRQSFEGILPARCAVHNRTGFQVNLRTGDPALPAVAVRISEYRGSGAYRAQLFVTGRSRTGSLASSTGEVSLEVRDGPPESGSALEASFEGAYQGGAGKGSVKGRFRGCSYALQTAGAAAPGR